MDTAKLLMALIRIAVCGETPTEEVKNACTPQMLEQVYTLGAKHDLAHLVGQGASKLQLEDSPVFGKCKKAAMAALVRHTRQAYDYQNICDLLETQKIPFLPLKGSVLRDFYPEPWLRTSCDMDILVKRKDIFRATELLEKAGWKQWEQSSNEITFTSKDNTVLELHHSLMEDHVTLPVKAILADIWQHAQPVNGKQYHMDLPAEWFYCCHLAHMAKHMVYGGCGVRPFLDLWVLDKKMPRHCLPAGSGLEKFGQAAEKLSRVWFDREPMDEMSFLLQEYVLSGGTYGSLKNQVDMQQVKKGGKGNYLLGRIFPPFSEMGGLFPVLQKHPWLTPVFYIVRLFRLLFGGKWKRSVRELQTVNAVSKDEKAETIALIHYLGL